MHLEVMTAADGDCAHVLVRTVAEAQPDEERSPLHLAVVIDRSSSMRGPRLAQAVRAASELASRLGPADRIAVISFDAAAQVVFGPAAVTDESRPALLAALRGLDSGAGTNLAAGFKKGAEVLGKTFVRGALTRLLLLTDGRPSMGVTNQAELRAMVATEREARGVTTTCMGIGESFDDELLAELAERGRGGFYYLARPEDIPAAFGRELAGVFAIAARDASMKLVPSDDVLSVELLHRLPSRPVDDGLVVEIGEVASGAPRQALFRLLRTPGSAGATLGTLTLTYARTDGSAGDPHIVGIDARSGDAAVVTLERLRLAVATAVDVAWARRAAGDADPSQAALRSVKEELVDLGQRGAVDAASLADLLAQIADAETAVTQGAAERERVRRSLRERSQVTLLGHSVLGRLPVDDD